MCSSGLQGVELGADFICCFNCLLVAPGEDNHVVQQSLRKNNDFHAYIDEPWHLFRKVIALVTVDCLASGIRVGRGLHLLL
jgi:hypothetical protein